MPDRSPPHPGPTPDLFREPHPAAAANPELHWPSPESFPLNLHDRSVEDQVKNDLLSAAEALIVTGYASLDRVVGLIASCKPGARVRLLFGNEPFSSQREHWQLSGDGLDNEVRDYWLARGISIRLSGQLIECIERLRSGIFKVRYPTGGERLHAKVYCGAEAVTLGSSNFTHAGLGGQLEANVRFLKRDEPDRFRETLGIAENYWSMARDCHDQFIALLEQLLRVVSWQEALARASAEMLEGEWAAEYLRGDYLPQESSLWESQKLGIAQALTILDSHDSVLIADATGSGKTRMGVHLVGALQDRNLRRGRLRRGRALMVCPPVVRDAWEREALYGNVNLQSFSHGSLSHSRSQAHEHTVESLRRAQLLCVDEGHNFVNFNSNRTQRLFRNMADHVLLFTATPINRSVTDLLRIADLLGADNLQPSTVEAFEKMFGSRSLRRALTEEEISQLRSEIGRFTVRRTKRMLNGLIQRDPDSYMDRNGRPCRFPKHKPKTYALSESAKDRRLAIEIRSLADRLVAVSHFKKALELPEVLRRQGVNERQYLEGRLNSARKLARYVVMASLRSSRAALVEHVAGTRVAVEKLELLGFERASPLEGALTRLQKIAGRLPGNQLKVELPEWLVDEDAHRRACSQDQALYEKMVELATAMSDGREQRKAEHLVKLLDKHELLLAFDSRPITLSDLSQRICSLDPLTEVLVATGDPGSDRSALLEAFSLGSDRKRLIGLCSDSLSEGVNLQQASVLVHLDMPSVVRIAEQRVGRVDRMDSPHRSIEAWWPVDAPEFALTSDERFLERYETVESLLGSNMPLPEEMLRQHEKPVSTTELVEEFEAADTAWDGIQDAFQPVRELIGDDKGLIPDVIYEEFRTVSVRVIARVSLVSTSKPWAFFCMRSASLGSPRWVFLPDLSGQIVTDLAEVCSELRKRLSPQTQSIPQLQRAHQRLLDAFLDRLSQCERELLSNKKQIALKEMERVLKHWAAESAAVQDQSRLDTYLELTDLLRGRSNGRQPDWDEIASRWLDVIRPVWYRRLTVKGRRKPLLLRDIRKDLLGMEAELGGDVIRSFAKFPRTKPMEERIAACIVGVDA